MAEASASKQLPTQAEIDRFCLAAGEKRDDATLKKLYAAYGDAIINGKYMGEIPAVSYAANWGHCDLLKWFIDKGADIHAASKDGFTNLMSAVWHTSTDEVVECLLKNGAGIDPVDKDGQTARMIAEEQGRVDAVRLIDQFAVAREAAEMMSKGAENPVRVMKPLRFR